MAASECSPFQFSNIIDTAFSAEGKSSDNSYTFYALSDFGNPTKELKEVAAAMDIYANQAEEQRPCMILGLGDNIYPRGVRSADDPEFKTRWSDIFLQYETLCVPWPMVLGNHDYMGNPQAQIDYTTSDSNESKLWKMPHNHYSFKYKNSDFFALDTNGCQGHVQRSHPNTMNNLRKQIMALESQLAETESESWKFVFGHHPMYNKGRGHGSVADCLREESYIARNRPYTGFGLENVIKKTDHVIYLSGHEHVFQHHFASGVHHIVCGNSGGDIREGAGFYDGENEDVDIDWFDTTNTYGFVSFHVTPQLVTIDFIDSKGKSFKQIEIENNHRRIMKEERGEEGNQIEEGKCQNKC